MSFHRLLFHYFSSRDSIQVHCVDLGESFQTHIYLQNLASIQPRTSPLKFAGSRDVTGPEHARSTIRPRRWSAVRAPRGLSLAGWQLVN